MRKLLFLGNHKVQITLILLYLFAFFNSNVALAKMRDPTCPTGGTCYQYSTNNTKVPALKIDCIIYNKNKKMVIVDGQKLTIGDRIQGLEVVDIFPDSIVVRDNNQTFNIALGYPNIKRAAHIEKTVSLQGS